MRCFRLVSVCLLIGSATISLCQNANTSLHGVIKDSSGALVPKAKVTLFDNATGHTFETTSSSAGEYNFSQIPPAKYLITAEAPGFADQKKSAELLVNQPATIDFTVAVQANEVVVNVSAEAQTLNTTDASLGNSMDNTLIQALPSEGRNVPDLLSLQPGVLYLGQNSGRPSNPSLQNDPRSGAVNGGRSDQGNITLDGLDDNDQVAGFAFTGVLRETQDSVEEFRVTTGLANADQGRSSGAQVSMVTKSGTNKFHGAAYEYNRPTITVSNDWFNKASQVGNGEPNIPPSQTAPTASYQQGIITYQGDDASGNVQTTTISASQVAALDTGCTANGVCPWGPGPNPNVLTYLNQFPAANGTSLGDGYNTGSYTFSSPNPVTLNTSIARIDYTPGQRHRFFVRGNLQKDTTAGTEQFPGQGLSYDLIDNTKGIAGGDTWSISSNLVNDVRYGYIRQGYSQRGPGTGDYVDFRFLTTLTSENRSTVVSVPVNNITDNLSWNKGKHSLQFGGNWRLVHHNRGTDANSYNSATSNPYWLGGNPPDPSTVGGLPVDGGFSDSYLIAYANLVGTIPQVTVQENYTINSPTTGTLLSDGAFINRHFSANEFEYYVQDSWRALPNLTVTFGLRHTILQTPWETKGQQIAPTVDTDAWFRQREASAQAGQVYEPDLTFAPTGHFYGKPAYWPKQKDNFAPRLAVVYSPDTKTTIRAGFGIFFDHYGEQLVDTFDQNGSFGTSSAISNPAGVYGYETSPRFTDRRTFPSIPTPPAQTNVTYPYTAPTGNFAITWGLLNKLKTPYSESIDLSLQRQIQGGFTLEANYVGRLGRHLLQSIDLAEPVNFRDTQSGVDYFTAGAQLSALVDANGGNFPAPVPAIPYFEDVFPYMANLEYMGESATQAIYNNEWAPFRSNLGATSALADLDFYCYSPLLGVSYGCPGAPRFWQDQFSSLYALSTIGMSYYNAAQLIVRHPTSHGLNVDFSYTFSKSIDMGSDTERGTIFNQFTGGPNGGGNSSIINSWNPSLNRAVSDFDTRHLITADWVYLLPVGQGRKYLSGGGLLTNAFLGGWQWSGINRWTSGLPFSLYDPGWTTDWDLEGNGVVTGKVQMKKQVVNGAPTVFANAGAINSGTNNGTPIRLSYPGETGERNNFRGDGIFGIDSGLSKSWRFGEYGALKFDWEVFNVTNSVRFNDNPSVFGVGLTGGNLGTYSAMQNLPRRMQFGLRYDF